MAEIAHAANVGKAICDALGLDPTKTEEVVITVRGPDIVSVQVKQCALVPEVGEVLRVLALYELRPAGTLQIVPAAEEPADPCPQRSASCPFKRRANCFDHNCLRHFERAGWPDAALKPLPPDHHPV